MSRYTTTAAGGPTGLVLNFPRKPGTVVDRYLVANSALDVAVMRTRRTPEDDPRFVEACKDLTTAIDARVEAENAYLVSIGADRRTDADDVIRQIDQWED